MTEQVLKLYSWPCSLTDSGSLLVLAYSVHHARALVRVHERADVFKQYILSKPSVTRGPHIVGM